MAGSSSKAGSLWPILSGSSGVRHGAAAKMVFHAAVLLWLVQTASAARFGIALEGETHLPGQTVDIVLVALPQSDQGDAGFPEEMECLLESAGREIRVIARQKGLVQEDGGAGQVKARKYSFVLPEQLEGSIMVRFAGVDAPRVVITAGGEGGALENTDRGAEKAPGSAEKYSSLDALSTLYQPYLKNTLAYEPTYFLVGSDPDKSKFQISFKYRIFDSTSPFAESLPWLEGIHFAFTQTSFWDLGSPSAPFADTSYKPELFWQSRNFLQAETGWFKGLYFQGGVQHESNGKADMESRSTNCAYAKPILVFYDEGSNYGLMLSSRIWGYIGNDNDTNPDLQDYRGNFDLEAKVGHGSGFVGGARLRWADRGTSVQFDLSYPLHNIFENFLDIYIYFQYVDMLAESLIDYQERTRALRLGFAIIR
jgi:phospholipase A1